MKVYFFPSTSQFNPYIDNIVKGLENNGVEIINKNDTNKFEKFISSIKAICKHTDIYHFNWIENKSDSDNIKSRIICKFIFIWFNSPAYIGINIIIYAIIVQIWMFNIFSLKINRSHF